MNILTRIPFPLRRGVSVFLCLCLTLCCTACAASRHHKEDRLQAIQERGYIEVCTEPYFAPFEFIDPSKTGDAQYVGMDMELARYMAQKLGVELRIVPLEFSALLAGMSEGKYDMAISALAYSPERGENMNLSKGYYFGEADYGFLVRQGEENRYDSIDSLKDAVVITQSGSVQEALYNQYINGACKEFKLVANMTDGYLAVAEGKADVCICSTASAQLYADANGGMSIPDYRFEVDPNMNGTCVAMPMEGTESLAELVNQCIAELKENGQTDVWYSEYEEQAAALGIE